MQIFLVDNNNKFRENLKFFLEGHLNHKVIGESDNGQSFIDSDILPEIVLMDISMPGMNGVETTKKGTWLYNQLKIIAVSQYSESVDLHQLISAGFKGFVSKTNLYRDLEKAMSAVHNGAFFFPEELNISNRKIEMPDLNIYQNDFL